MKEIGRINFISAVALWCLAACTASAWWNIMGSTHIVRVMINADKNQTLGSGDCSIDLAIITSPVSSAFGGYGTLLNECRIGAFVYNGRSAADSDAAAWESLRAAIQEKNIPLITLGAGDTIRYNHSFITILSPDRVFAHSPDASDAAMVLKIQTGRTPVLVARTAEPTIFQEIIKNYGPLAIPFVVASTSKMIMLQ